jgi:hypothetical protein
MKKLAICAVSLLASVSIFAQAPQTYKGEIIDSQCAALGGHQVMAKPGESEKDCTNRCVQIHALRSCYQDRLSTRRRQEGCNLCRRQGVRYWNPKCHDQDDPRGQHQGRSLARTSRRIA